MLKRTPLPMVRTYNFAFQPMLHNMLRWSEDAVDSQGRFSRDRDLEMHKLVAERVTKQTKAA